jgi:catechol 2,3-dioxygenase-like lactoylglutathione lyase family enzyme
MTQAPTGVHHVAFMAADIKQHIEFFSQVVGAPLVAIFDMHGVPGGLHAFLKLGEHNYFSVVQLPNVGDIPREIGKTHAGWGGGTSASGTLQHIALAADDEAHLLACRDRIRSHGVNVMGPLDHGFCKSIYFAGPDDMTLEIACPARELVPDRWIDPAVCERAGIGADDVARYRAPADYAGETPVAQPAYDAAKPHMHYPSQDLYRAILAAPDEALAAAAAYVEPPVPA